MLKFVSDKILLVIAGLVLFFLTLNFVFGQNYLFEAIRYITYRLPGYSINYTAPAVNWKEYELKGIKFQAPENYEVKFYKSAGGDIASADILIGAGFIHIDTNFFRGLSSYEDAIKYYKNNNKIRVFEFKKLGKGMKVLGQRSEFVGLGYRWRDFTEVVVPVGNKLILVEYQNGYFINSEILEKIATSIKPL